MSTLISTAGFGPVTASILVLAAVGFTLQFGISNVLNLAYGDTMTAAAYAAYLANRVGLGLWPMLLAGGIKADGTAVVTISPAAIAAVK